MYFLNDVHPEYEYVVFCRVGNAQPYLKTVFSKFSQVEQFIQGVEKWHNRYNQIFYIDNDFYKNYYTKQINGTYYKILRRKVNDWEEFSADSKNFIKIA